MKNLLLFIFCFTLLSSSAQKNQISISPIFGLDSRPISASVFNKRIYSPQSLNYSVGINASYYIPKNKVTFDLTFLYHSFKYNNSSNHGFLTTFSGDNLSAIFDVKYLKIPMGIDYRLLNKNIFKIDLALGGSFDYLLSSFIDAYCEYYYSTCYTQSVRSQDYTISVYLGSKFSMYLSKKIVLSFQPTLDYYNNGFDNIKKNRIINTSMYFGLGYTFSQKEH